MKELKTIWKYFKSNAHQFTRNRFVTFVNYSKNVAKEVFTFKTSHHSNALPKCRKLFGFLRLWHFHIASHLGTWKLLGMTLLTKWRYAQNWKVECWNQFFNLHVTLEFSWILASQYPITNRQELLICQFDSTVLWKNTFNSILNPYFSLRFDSRHFVLSSIIAFLHSKLLVLRYQLYQLSFAVGCEWKK